MSTPAHSTETTPPKSANVEVLAAEVRTVMVGNRQVTLSVYRQLDDVSITDIEPWGRVRSGNRALPARAVEIIGRRAGSGDLVRSVCYQPEYGQVLDLWFDDEEFSEHFVAGPYSRGTWPGPCGEYWQWADHGADLPYLGESVTVRSRDGFTVRAVAPRRKVMVIQPNAAPGSYSFANAAAREYVLAEAEELIDDTIRTRTRYREITELPLIVLAGLR